MIGSRDAQSRALFWERRCIVINTAPVVQMETSTSPSTVRLGMGEFSN